MKVRNRFASCSLPSEDNENKTNSNHDKSRYQVELNLREFNSNSRIKFLERISKGPPSCFRWISWVIGAGIPEYRLQNLFDTYYLTPINQEIDDQIKKDLQRTMSDVTPSKKDKEFILYKILKAFAASDQEVGYCQGMNFIANFILQISEYNELESYYMLLTLFSETFTDKLGIRGFYTQGFAMLNYYLELFDFFFKRNHPKLRKHFNEIDLPKEAWVSKWFQTLFTVCLPFRALERLWDCIISQGLIFMVKFALALLSKLESKLLKLNEVFEVIDYFRLLSPFNSNHLNAMRINSPTYDISIKSNDNPSLPSMRLDLEELIINAKKIKLDSVIIKQVKKNYERENKITLESLNCKYDLCKNFDEISINNESDQYLKMSKAPSGNLLASPNDPQVKELSNSLLNLLVNEFRTKKSSENLIINNSQSNNNPIGNLTENSNIVNSVDYYDDVVENEIDDFKIEDKIDMYKFNYNMNQNTNKRSSGNSRMD